MNLSINDFLLILSVIMVFLVVIIFSQFRKITSLMELYVGHSLKKQLPRKDEEKEKRMLNLKLQAYERIILFVERVKPDSMIPRTLSGGLTSRDYHILLLGQIRSEYEYNLSQQLYMSTDAWNMVNDYKNNVCTLINSSANEIQSTDEAGKLARHIVENYIKSQINVEPILEKLRTEVQNMA